MCILLKLDYAKFGVSNLFCSKVTEKKTFGGRPPQEGFNLVQLQLLKIEMLWAPLSPPRSFLKGKTASYILLKRECSEK